MDTKKVKKQNQNSNMLKPREDANIRKAVKTRVLAGMRPSGQLHIGNYLGAAKGMIALQEDPAYESYYMVVDLHAMTTPYDRSNLADETMSVVLDYLASGLDPEKSAVFVQSQVPEHTEMAYYLSAVVSVGRMNQLPTYKEKVKQFPSAVTMAMLNYGVLMAADILLYKAEKVPVGLDQEPHIELARDIASKMNETYKTDFPMPKRFTLSGSEYIPSLKGEGKMSKSVEGSYINLTDNLETIRKRLAGAPTDVGKGEKVPVSGGVATLLQLVKLFEGEEKAENYKKQYISTGIRYADLKAELAEAIFVELQPIQERRAELERHPDKVKEILIAGAEKARKTARETLDAVRDAMGVVRI